MPTIARHPLPRRCFSLLPAQIERARLGVVRGLGALIEAADGYTYGHCARVAAYAMNIARALALDAHQLATVAIGAYLHDLGKVLVPHAILNKPGLLAQEEVEVIRTHPVRGVELLAAIELPWDIKPIVRWHHERYDGTGYPDGLCGAEVPIDAQIIGIADAYDALTTTRSYRPAVSPSAALAEMDAQRRHWDPDVYGAFLTIFTRESARVA